LISAAGSSSTGERAAASAAAISHAKKQ
jgi:hypothetical protein